MAAMRAAEVLAVVREHGPSLAVAWTTAAGLALVAPLEHSAGLALGLGDAHAWAITATIEGATGAALVAGRLVPAALALTGSSVLVGMLQSAGSLPAGDSRVLAVGMTVLAVSALALVHRVRAGILTGRARAGVEEAERARAVRAQDDERAARLRASDERAGAAGHARAMERERAASWARQSEIRLSLQVEEARRATEEARAQQEMKRAQASRERAVPERARARSGASDDITARRARVEWARREGTSAPMTGSELGALLGVTDGAARKIAQRWRRGAQAGDKAAGA